VYCQPNSLSSQVYNLSNLLVTSAHNTKPPLDRAQNLLGRSTPAARRCFTFFLTNGEAMTIVAI